MDRIDRYITRQFVLTFFFGILAFALIYIAVDLMEHLDDFFDHNVPTSGILGFYLYSLPDIVHLIVPIATLLASIFTIGRLDTSNELTAIRAGGRSMKRIALPLLLVGAIVSVGMIYFNGWIVPKANKERYAIDRQYLGGSLGASQLSGQRNVFLRVSPKVNLQIDYFDPATGEANQVSIERFDTAAPVVTETIQRISDSEFVTRSDTAITLKITERIDAARMKYDSVGKKWVLHNGVARNFTDPTVIAATTFQVQDAPPLPITPEELNLSQQNLGELTIEEMRDRIEQERIGGRDINRLLVDYYARYAFPFSALIVIFFGIPFSSAQRKSGAATQIAVTALVSAAYLVLTEVSKTFSYGTDIHPALTAWMVNILFFIVGVFNLYRIERG